MIGAAYNPRDPKRVRRLAEAVKLSRRILLPERERAFRYAQAFAGHHYGNLGTSAPEIYNFMELATTAHIQHFVARVPQVLISTSETDLGGVSARFELNVNRLIRDEINVREVNQTLVRDALLSGMGIVQIGYDPAKYAAFVNGYRRGAQRIPVFLDNIPLDYWVHDCNAESWESCTFMGDIEWWPLEVAREEPTFDKKMRGRLQADRYNQFGEFGEYKLSQLSRGVGWNDEVYEDRVAFLNLWHPREQIFSKYVWDATAGDISEDKPIRTIDWHGTQLANGPYFRLAFQKLSRNVMGLAPASVWYEIHMLGAEIMRKMAEEARNFKRIMVGRNTEDMERIAGASDGQTVPITDPVPPVEVSYRGVDGGLVAFFESLRNWASYQVGNLNAMAGLDVVADTLGQEKMIVESASKKIQAMQTEVLVTETEIIRELARYVWESGIPLEASRDYGFGVRDIIPFGQADRSSVPFDYLDFKIEPYTMQDQSPGQKLQAVSMIWNQYVAPVLPMLPQMGVQLDYPAVVEFVAKMAHVSEEFSHFFIRMQAQAAGGQEGGRHSSSNRVNTRVSRPGGGAGKIGSQMASLMQAMPNGQNNGAFAPLARVAGAAR